MEEKLNIILKNLINKSKEEVIQILSKSNELSNSEKNLLLNYLFPRPLLDRELPPRIQEYRLQYNSSAGYLIPNIIEVGLIIEAYKTPQYNRFIRHLFHSFSDTEKLHPVSGINQDKCCICDKTIYQYDSWIDICNRSYKPELEKKEYLSFGSDESGLNICLPCLIQLQKARELLEMFEPGFLNLKFPN